MSQLNHNISYITEIDGETPWERLRIVRNFLKDRKLALDLAYLAHERAEEEKETWNKWQRREHELNLPQSKELIADTEREINFLVELEANLTTLAEQSRIPGKTDEEMYELNYVQEIALKHIRLALTEKASMGYVTPSTLRSLIRNPLCTQRALDLGLVNIAAVELYNSTEQELTSFVRLETPGALPLIAPTEQKTLADPNQPKSYNKW